jgi:hypothetical protein
LIVCTAINENAMVGEDDFNNLKEDKQLGGGISFGYFSD